MRIILIFQFTNLILNSTHRKKNCSGKATPISRYKCFFQKIRSKNYKIQNRVLLSRYRGKTTCTECNGARLRNESSYVKINGMSLPELVHLPIDEAMRFFQRLFLMNKKAIASRLLTEITSRLTFMKDVGLGYLSLNRKSNTLSGGESQRINLATSLGSSLVGSMYILDEPSIGLILETMNV